MTFKPIKVPTDVLKAGEIGRVIKNTLNAVALAAKADFGTTTRTWKDRPEFTIEKPDEETRVVRTANKIYEFVDKGTRPHIIRPRRGGRLTWMGVAYRAKTQPNVIGSKTGGNDNTIVWTKVVHHPGTAARNFSIAIRDKWAKEMHIRMEAALVAVVKNRMP